VITETNGWTTNIPASPGILAAIFRQPPQFNPTNTRWVVLFLISLMYLLTYMDRSNISVAAPGHREGIRTQQDRNGVCFQRVFVGICDRADPWRVAGGPLRTQKGCFWRLSPSGRLRWVANRFNHRCNFSYCYTFCSWVERSGAAFPIATSRHANCGFAKSERGARARRHA